MDEITTPRPQNAVVKYYKPSELLGMFTSYLSQQDVNRQVIYLQGIYLKNPKHDPRWTSRYDILRDENTQTEITLQIPHKLCEDLKDGTRTRLREWNCAARRQLLVLGMLMLFWNSYYILTKDPKSHFCLQAPLSP